VPTVQVLDPATGTGTFLKYVIKEIKNTFDEKHKELNDDELKEEWNKYVPKHLLPRIFGFELMAAPYAVAHLKLGLELAETGYDFKSDKRLGVYLTNTLDGTHEGSGTLDSYLWLAEEGRKADEIKANSQISVVIGNPPYSGHSANKSQWIADLLRGKIKDKSRVSNYFEVDGGPLGERNPKWLNDDYVKFIRFGQWRIDKTGRGILAFITNHGYLDNPTFRGMRQQLMESFSDIYILDLHGNSKKKEKCPDGSKDENVFDIQQGVSIGFLVKKPKSKGQTNIYYADLWGVRSQKYSELLKNDISTMNWEALNPSSPFYLFKPQNIELRNEYEYGFKIDDLMPVNSVGIVTARDKLTIHESPEDVWETVIDFSNVDEEVARNKYNLGKDVQDWKVNFAQSDLIESGLDEHKIVPILYRPFDIRYTYYTGKATGFLCRPRTEVMKHMLHENIAIITVRQVAEGIFNHVFVTENITESRITLSNKGIAYVFPLTLFNNDNKFNFNHEIINDLPDFIKKSGPRGIFDYSYALLHSPTYRERYNEFLKIDSPKILFTNNNNLFLRLNEFGKELINLHLMKSDKLNNFITTFVGDDNNEVGSIGKKSYKDGRLYINKSEYFDGITEDVFNFYLGGYQVCQKWVKDRKGRTLTEEEIEHYQKIVVAINETIHIMKEIDEGIEEHGGWPIK
jgi:predicted helicase